MKKRRPARGRAAFCISDAGETYAVASLARWLLLRAARFGCTRFLRAARSSRLTAARRSSAVAVGALAFFSAVRSAERWARLRTVAERVFRMFFFADAIFGTEQSPVVSRYRDRREP